MVVCQLGLRPPEDTTLEALGALAECDVVYLLDRNASLIRFLRGRCRGVLAAGGGTARSCRLLLGKGGTVGIGGSFAAMAGGAWNGLLREISEGGLRPEIIEGISPLGAFLTESGLSLGVDIQGLEMAPASGAWSGPNPSLPLVVHGAPGGPGGRLKGTSPPAGFGAARPLSGGLSGFLPEGTAPPGRSRVAAAPMGEGEPSLQADERLRAGLRRAAADAPPGEGDCLERIAMALRLSQTQDLPPGADPRDATADSGEGQWDAALAELEGYRLAHPRSWAALALKGGVYLRLWKLEEALSCLEIPAARGAVPAARFWRAESLLGLGRTAEGLRELQATAVPDGDLSPWAHFEGVVSRRPPSALPALRRDLGAIHRKTPSAAGCCLSGLAALREGDVPAGLQALGEAVAMDRGGRALGVRAVELRRLGDNGRSLEDLAQAQRGGEKRWAHFERGRTLFQMSAPRENILEAFDRALALGKGGAVLYAWRGAFRVIMRNFPEALLDANRAVRLDRNNPHWYALRAGVLMELGKAALAERDLGFAARLDPLSARWRERRLDAAIRARRWGAVRLLDHEESRSFGRSAGSPRLRLLRGIGSIAQGRYEEAVARLARDGALPGPLARDFRFYLEAARLLRDGGSQRSKEAARPRQERRARAVEGRKRGPLLLILGMGVRPPYQATCEQVRALRGCDLVISNFPNDEGMNRFLSALGREFVPMGSGNGGREAMAARALSKGRRVAFVTRGNPMLFGSIPQVFIAEAERQGAPWRIFPSVSSMEALLKPGPGGGPRWAASAQVWDESFALRGDRGDSGSPLLIYFKTTLWNLSEENRGLLRASLARVAPGDPYCELYGYDYGAPAARIRLSRLGLGPPVRGDIQAVLLPPK